MHNFQAPGPDRAPFHKQMNRNALRIEYRQPRSEEIPVCPATLCDSAVGGDIEDLTLEDWTL